MMSEYDKEDALTPLIAESHPTKTKSYATYDKARSAVNNRHSKDALVNLVNYLMAENNKKDGIISALQHVKEMNLSETLVDEIPDDVLEKWDATNENAAVGFGEHPADLPQKMKPPVWKEDND